MRPRPPSVVVDPSLEAAEVEFLAAFACKTGQAGVRRVWPGQPSRHCPWRPTPDGQYLLLDLPLAASEPDSVAGWLRFLSREFLAPSTAAALDTALTLGLRGGHRLSGHVDLGTGRRVTVQLGRVTEEVRPASSVAPPDVAVVADVVDLSTHRAAAHTER